MIKPNQKAEVSLQSILKNKNHYTFLDIEKLKEECASTTNKPSKFLITLPAEKVYITHHNKTPVIFVCDYCNKEFNSFLGYQKEKDACPNCVVLKIKENRKPTPKKEKVIDTRTAKEKREATNMKKYGGKSPFCSKEVREKSKKTVLERYNTNNVLKVKEFQNKRDKTVLEKYGVTNISLHPDIQKKKEDTCLKNFGVKYPSQNKEVYEKQKMIFKEKYGVDNPCKNKKISNKIKETWSNIDKNTKEKIIESRARTFLLNKGYLAEEIDNSEYTYSELKQNEFRIDNYSNRVRYALNQGFEIVTTLEDFHTIHKPQAGITIKYRHIECGKEFEQYNNYGFMSDNSFINCPYCPLPYEGSREQSEVYNFLKTIYSKPILQNDRSCLHNSEIDLLLPDINLGIEYNGTIWHTETFAHKNKHYHIDKWKQAKEKGIDLLFIYDFEWKEKKEIVKSILRNRLGLHDKKIYARNTYTKQVSLEEAKEFYLLNHIQGSNINSKQIHLGLYSSDNILVSLITFSDNSIRTKDWELVRFANKLNTIVVGGFSKLLKHFEKTYLPTKIVTYSEVRLFTSKVYEKNGFTLSHITSPSYFYTLHGKFYGHRQRFQKSMIKKKFNNYNDNLTEYENMLNNGFDRVWDCGVRVFVKEY